MQVGGWGVLYAGAQVVAIVLASGKAGVQAERIIFIACGTSYYAANVAQYLVEQVSGLPVQIDIASEFRYRKPIIPKNTLVITISQSGETADTLAAIRLAKEKVGQRGRATGGRREE